jgi:HPt (histidine-containing phosphotransfer) domain-containing protein
MPIMDGYTATNRIRNLDGARARIPIVALTANAMTGQLERCLEAGMDGLLTKPLAIERLQEVIEKFVLRREPLQGAAVEQIITAPEAQMPIDLVRLCETVGDDAEFTRDLVQTYLDNALDTLAEMRSAVQRRDAMRVARLAHSLKGASANMHARVAHEICVELESLAASGGVDEQTRALNRLETEVGRVRAMLESLASGPAANAAKG